MRRASSCRKRPLSLIMSLTLIITMAPVFAGPVFAPGQKLFVIKTEHFDIIFSDKSRGKCASLIHYGRVGIRRGDRQARHEAERANPGDYHARYRELQRLLLPLPLPAYSALRHLARSRLDQFQGQLPQSLPSRVHSRGIASNTCALGLLLFRSLWLLGPARSPQYARVHGRGRDGQLRERRTSRRASPTILWSRSAYGRTSSKTASSRRSSVLASTTSIRAATSSTNTADSSMPISRRPTEWRSTPSSGRPWET